MININDDLLIQNINEIRKHNNFQTIKNEFGEKNLRNLFLRLYPKYTIKELEKMINVPDSTIARWFKMLKIPSNKRWHIKILSKVGNKNQERLINDAGIIKKMFTVKMTTDLAYLIGFSLGDGSTQKYVIEVFNKDMEIRKYLYDILRLYGDAKEKEIRNYGLWTLRLNSIQISNLIKNEKEINEHTIDYIFNRKYLARKFVAAFWDAEGRVAREDNRNYFHIYLYNTNKFLIDKICSFLKTQRIDYSIHSRFDLNRQYFLKDRQIRTKKVIHRISIPKRSALIWAKEVGIHMVHSKKRQIVKDILSYSNR